jgi:hypothetical protein
VKHLLFADAKALENVIEHIIGRCLTGYFADSGEGIAQIEGK